MFNRKNKTLRAVLTTKSVLKLLEENRKTFLSLQQQHQSTDGMIDDDSDNKSIKDIVEGIVDKEPWKGQRASKLSLDDFLQLLAEFNAAGIHFR